MENDTQSGKRVIGVTGPMCSGKNAVCAVLEKAGFLCIDVDLLGHQALKEKRDAVVAVFGNGILDADGSISRKKLGSVVFSRKKQLAKLEEIVHPWMRTKVGEMIVAHDGDVAVNAAVLFTMELDRLCDSVLWVDAPLCTRVFRLMRRNGVSFFTALRRIAGQNVIRANYSSSHTDIYDIRNTGSGAYLEDQVWKFLNEM